MKRVVMFILLSTAFSGFSLTVDQVLYSTNSQSLSATLANYTTVLQTDPPSASSLSTYAYSNSVAMFQFVTASSNQPVCPVGMILALPISMVPIGWLECDGSAYNMSVYSNLYRIIGYNFGSNWVSSNVAPQFCVPALAGSFLRGSTTINVDGVNAKVGYKESSGITAHSHGISRGGGGPYWLAVNNGTITIDGYNAFAVWWETSQYPFRTDTSSRPPTWFWGYSASGYVADPYSPNKITKWTGSIDISFGPLIGVSSYSNSLASYYNDTFHPINKSVMFIIKY